MPQSQPVPDAHLGAPAWCRGRIAAWWRARTPAQRYCAIIGVLLGVRGAQQLIAGPSFATPGDGWRASQQLLTAIALLLASRDRTFAYRALIPFTAFYTVLAIVGDINGHEAFGLVPVDGRDLFAHPIYAVTALLILALPLRRARVRSPARAPHRG
jgi:hypothetical protein